MRSLRRSHDSPDLRPRFAAENPRSNFASKLPLRLANKKELRGVAPRARGVKSPLRCDRPGGVPDLPSLRSVQAG